MKIFNLFKFKKNKNNSSIEKIIVGLGNCYPKYDNTRHNAGFEALDFFLKENNIELKKKKFNSLVAIEKINGVRCLLMKPLTLMNGSGVAVEQAKNYYKIAIEDIIVLVDDISFDVGRIKIKKNGSAGTHNGLKSIIYETGEENFCRIKIGVGKKPNKDYDLAKWVLAKFNENETNKMKKTYENVSKALYLIVDGKIETAMNSFNKNNI